MDTQNPTTELEAVNTLLDAIGEAPVSSLENTGLIDVVKARSVLHEESRRFQKRGWWFNTDRAFELPLTFPDKNILVPTDALKIDTAGASKGTDVVSRGGKLWNVTDNTFAFEAALQCDIVRFLPFDDMPEAARDYIVVCSALTYVKRQDRSTDQVKFTADDKRDAWVEVMRAETESVDSNMLNSSFVAGIRGR